MTNTFLLDIITPQRQAFSESVYSIVVPTTRGLIGILPHHEPLFSALSEGEIKITAGNKEYSLAIGGGFMEVSQDKVTVLVSRAVHANELNEAEIKRAYESAREAIKTKAKGEELSQAQALLRRSLLELKVYRRHKQKTPLSSS
jgi:F-type H+-transporting ATPase subunit epsilon